MALLKKIKSSTLIEALVATVLIVIVFMTASLILNNLLLNSFSKNTHGVETRINELEYNFRNGIITLPYKEKFRQWDISVNREVNDSLNWVRFSASNLSGKKDVTKSFSYVQQ